MGTFLAVSTLHFISNY